MKKSVIICTALLISHWISHWGWAQTGPACRDHNPNAADVPLCPANGSTILPDAYPAMAVSLSDIEGGPSFAVDFVAKVLGAQPNLPPQFFLNVTPDTLNKIKAEVAKKAGSLEQKTKWLAALTHVPGARWNWQQDFFQPQTDPATGKPVLRALNAYRTRPDSPPSIFKNLSQAMNKTCGVTAGPPHPNRMDKKKDGYRQEAAPGGASGGNLEGGPAGLCLIGTDEFSLGEHQRTARDVCGTSRVVPVPSGWLTVGHTDEITTTVRTGPGDCDFAVLIASPKAAREVFLKEPNAPAIQLLERAPMGHEAIGASDLWDLCKQRRRKGERSGGSATTTSGLESFAGRDLASAPENISPRKAEAVIANCDGLSNRELAEYFTGQGPKAKINNFVDEEMQNFKADLEKAWREETPHCKPKFVEVPALFGGKWIKEAKLVIEGDSIFPNVTNLQQFGDTLLIPDPFNETLRADLKSRLKALGLKAEFINTNFAHRVSGNLHCSTNVVRYCRPRTVGKTQAEKTQ